MIFKRLLLALAISASLFGLLRALPVKAVECGAIPQSVCDAVVNNPDLTATGAITPLVDYVVNILTGLFVVAVILIIIVSGVQMSASAGNPEVIKNAKNHIFNAVLGIALLISARAILSLFGIYDAGLPVKPPVTLFSDINRSSLVIGDFQKVLLNGIALATSLAGIVSIVFLIVGGIRYIISAGNPEVRSPLPLRRSSRQAERMHRASS